MVIQNSALAGPRGNRLNLDARQLRSKDDVLLAATIVDVVYDLSSLFCAVALEDCGGI